MLAYRVRGSSDFTSGKAIGPVMMDRPQFPRRPLVPVVACARVIHGDIAASP